MLNGLLGGAQPADQGELGPVKPDHVPVMSYVMTVRSAGRTRGEVSIGVSVSQENARTRRTVEDGRVARKVRERSPICADDALRRHIHRETGVDAGDAAERLEEEEEVGRVRRRDDVVALALRTRVLPVLRDSSSQTAHIDV